MKEEDGDDDGEVAKEEKENEEGNRKVKARKKLDGVVKGKRVRKRKS